MSLTVTRRPMTSQTSETRPTLGAVVLAFTLVYVCWGTTYLALKIGVQKAAMPPLMFGGARISIAGLLVLGWLWLRGKPILLPAGSRLPVALCAVLLFVGGNGLLNVAGQTLDSGVCAVLIATTPLWVGMFELLWPRGDRLTARGWVGLLLGVVGVVILCVPNFQNATDLAANVGVYAALASAAAWAVGSLASRYHRVQCSHLLAAAYQMIVGGGCLTAVGLSIGELGRMPEQISGDAIGAFLWLLVFGSLVGFTAYNWLLTHVSVTHVGTYAYVNPAIAVVIGVAYGEQASAWLLGGIVVILFGVALLRGGLRPAARR